MVEDKLIYYFLSSNLKFTLSKQEIDEFTWANQEKFLQFTIYNNIVKKYPLSENFCRLFFKKILEYVEPYQEIHDGIFEFLCNIMKTKQDKDPFCYRHYIFNKDLNNIITIKETNSMVVNGTTGMKTWEAALILSDWIISNKDLVLDKNVLELGAGVGFTGITIAKLCAAKSISITDYHPDVLRLLEENITLNFPELQKEMRSQSVSFYSHDNDISVRKLDWNTTEDYETLQSPDVIIGADIVYDPPLLKSICNVIQSFIKRNPETQVFIASILRNENTFQNFLDHLGEIDVSVEKYIPTKCKFLHWDLEQKSCLIKIKKSL